MKQLLPAFIIIVFGSCSNYYKAIKVTNPSTVFTITDLTIKGSHSILRNGNYVKDVGNTVGAIPLVVAVKMALRISTSITSAK